MATLAVLSARVRFEVAKQVAFYNSAVWLCLKRHLLSDQSEESPVEEGNACRPVLMPDVSLQKPVCLPPFENAFLISSRLQLNIKFSIAFCNKIPFYL